MRSVFLLPMAEPREMRFDVDGNLAKDLMLYLGRADETTRVLKSELVLPPHPSVAAAGSKP